MAKCKWCDKSGLFFSVNNMGLCKNCAPAVTMEVTNKQRIIKESLELVEKSKKLDTKLHRFDLAIEKLRELEKYELRGISFFAEPPSQICRELMGKKDEVIVAGLEEELQKAEKKAEAAATTKTAVNALTKVLENAAEMKPQAIDPAPIANMELDIRAKLDSLKYQGFLEEAKKAEFKNQKKEGTRSIS